MGDGETKLLPVAEATTSLGEGGRGWEKRETPSGRCGDHLPRGGRQVDGET